MDKSKVSRAASRLEKNGYVRKDTDPQDGRLVALSLTNKGRAMVDEIIPLAQQFEADLVHRIPQASDLTHTLSAFLEDDADHRTS